MSITCLHTRIICPKLDRLKTNFLQLLKTVPVVCGHCKFGTHVIRLRLQQARIQLDLLREEIETKLLTFIIQFIFVNVFCTKKVILEGEKFPIYLRLVPRLGSNKWTTLEIVTIDIDMYIYSSHLVSMPKRFFDSLSEVINV